MTSVLYVLACRVLELVVLLGRSERSKDLEQVLRVFVRRYNGHRPHRALALQPPEMTAAPSTRSDPTTPATTVRRRELLG